ncbi:MAG: acetyl-CoA C-acetyltransferase [Deltaproteobacteria bacterium]|nr:acetyl-CoA C-acetyltransferase [Deltaproteobacteria bacterium]MBW2071560.1 acetyl-CoA C-acetyltransferase [Deltaproteobacteria bacterium]
MREVVIASAVRTPIGSFGGTLRDVPAVDLGSIAIKEVLARAKVRPEKVDEVVMGNVLQAGLGQNPARQSAIHAGLSQYIPAVTVNKVGGSGMKAVTMAAQAIKAGDAEIIVAGGMENMSEAPFVLPHSRWGQRMGHDQLIDIMLQDALWCSFGHQPLGVTAEHIAEKFGISREEQDAYALESHRKAITAINEGRFKKEIIPVTVPRLKAEPIIFDTDEHPRDDLTMEELAKCRPAFKEDGTITAMNSAGINDGAAALLLMSAEKAFTMGIKPLAKIVAYDYQGCEPELMGTGAIYAARSVIHKVSEKLGKPVDLVELVEAFAVQAIACLRELQLDPQIVNVNGGTIALGHPVGCSGARILTSLLYEMERRDAKVGLAALCIGGGMGIATVLEREWYF